ncbi:MAG: hypothetical protein A2Y61_00270 [Chloroflexi bacterium RBG_13_60_13]|nr:MAG: hypothetical protein A2Y61_00270 [Chloroflexi bacterium RBG_13_60_13]
MEKQIDPKEKSIKESTGKGQRPKIVEMPLGDFAQQAGADPGTPVETITREQLDQRLSDLLSGKIEPANEFVAYLANRLKEGVQEDQLLQQNIQQINQRLAQLQRRSIQLQGEQHRYVQDIMAWWDREPKELCPADKPADTESA